VLVTSRCEHSPRACSPGLGIALQVRMLGVQNAAGLEDEGLTGVSAFIKTGGASLAAAVSSARCCLLTNALHG
jgi:hypothetical protein